MGLFMACYHMSKSEFWSLTTEELHGLLAALPVALPLMGNDSFGDLASGVSDEAKSRRQQQDRQATDRLTSAIETGQLKPRR